MLKHTKSALKLIKTYYTEPDGFYVLDRLKAGQYKLVIDHEFMTEKNINCEPCELRFSTDDAEEHLLFGDVVTLTENPVVKPLKTSP